MLARQIRRLPPGLVLLQHPDGLIFREPCSLHLSVLQEGRTLNPRGGKSQRQVTRDQVAAFGEGARRADTPAAGRSASGDERIFRGGAGPAARRGAGRVGVLTRLRRSRCCTVSGTASPRLAG